MMKNNLRKTPPKAPALKIPARFWGLFFSNYLFPRNRANLPPKTAFGDVSLDSLVLWISTRDT
jgi:hypothetical protein